MGGAGSDRAPHELAKSEAPGTGAPPITGEPREEAIPGRPEQSESKRDGGEGGGGRFAGLVALGIAMAVLVAVVAWLAVGAQYAIPVLVLVVIAVAFVVIHRVLGQMKTRQYGDHAQDEAADKGDDSVPHFGFDESSQLGEGDEYSDVDDEERNVHGDMNRSTGSS